MSFLEVFLKLSRFFKKFFEWTKYSEDRKREREREREMFFLFENFVLNLKDIFLI